MTVLTLTVARKKKNRIIDDTWKNEFLTYAVRNYTVHRKGSRTVFRDRSLSIPNSIKYSILHARINNTVFRTEKTVANDNPAALT